MRGRSMATRSSPAARQRPMGSFSQTGGFSSVSSHEWPVFLLELLREGPRCSYFDKTIRPRNCSVSNDNGDSIVGVGVDDNVLMVGWKKEKVRASKCKSSNREISSEAGGSRSDGEDGGPFREMRCTSVTSLTSRKTVRFQGKVAEDSDAVDPVTVPRKLRSAINKRCSQSSSSTITNAKNKHHHSNGHRVLSGNGGKRCKPYTLLGSFTKDEAEVVEALCALSRMLPLAKKIPGKEGKKASEANQDNSAACLEGLNKDPENLLQQSVTCETKSPSSCLEKPQETTKDRHFSSKQSIALSGNTNDSGSNRKSESISHVTISENKRLKHSSSQNYIKFPSPPGVMQPNQCDNNETLPSGCIGSTALRHEVQPAKPNSQNSAKPLHVEGTIPPHSQPSSKTALWPGPVTSASRLSSSRINFQTDKVSLDVTSTWKKCAIHIFICHWIKSYQDKGKQRTLPLAHKELKLRDGVQLSVPASSEKAMSQSGLHDMPSALERNKQEEGNKVLYNGIFMPVQQSPASSEAKQKQACDFVLLSGSVDSTNSANGVKSHGQFHSPLLHAQVPHHSLVPFPFPRAPYAPLVATQQVQLQAPHFIGNRYPGPQMERTMGNIHLQQQLWQAHISHYRAAPVGIGMSQNERVLDSSASLCPSAPTSSTISPLPSIQMRGSYCPPDFHHHHQLLANGSISLSSKGKPHRPKQLGNLH